MSFTYEYPRPAVTTDVVLFSREHDQWRVLLIQRMKDPFRECWALPGGFLDADEDPKDGAARELEEETGIRGLTLQPLGFWGRPDRDPRGHTISLVHWAIIEGPCPEAVAGDDAKSLSWHSLNDLPALAFDHDEILQEASKRLAAEG